MSNNIQEIRHNIQVALGPNPNISAPIERMKVLNMPDAEYLIQRQNCIIQSKSELERLGSFRGIGFLVQMGRLAIAINQNQVLLKLDVDFLERGFNGCDTVKQAQTVLQRYLTSRAVEYNKTILHLLSYTKEEVFTMRNMDGAKEYLFRKTRDLYRENEPAFKSGRLSALVVRDVSDKAISDVTNGFRMGYYTGFFPEE